MKKVKFILLIILIIPILGLAQSLENLDYISPFHNGYAAIKKDNQWAFINTEGAIAIDFRNDLVARTVGDVNYPMFSDDRCLIEELKEGISYFGYIDTFGKTVIKPQFLNATNFSEGSSIALKLVKEIVGENEALVKNIVYYRYFEVTIDIEGNVINYLTPKGKNVVLDKEFLTYPPEIMSKQISKNVFAIKGKGNRWTIINNK
ncbi:WG repeat-containing protein [Mariniflexile litorale]|uniref:WG repeat-containing protein n=1 Tax=Mariniflexile litorale TaxID=3045158 RepID=A0AAU7EE79_9FLAO|nr:WG repeat-containing protein [Mariniflexile sp. KMM 9835]MDQ8212428.1 WG repeat-containing protein [Mariniflexile sp. KMM 9835]